MNHASLFSGIGGFDLASEWMGWNNVLHCEINTFCQRVLKYYWPDATSYSDIKTTDFTVHSGTIDILTGGFPCQPYSTAGKRKGKEDERHLWPEMLRAIREISPRWVVGENVSGLVSWNGGMVFKEVQADLEAEGYEVLPFLLPACGVNAPHKRERVWFIAHATICNDHRNKRGFSETECRSKFNNISSLGESGNGLCEEKITPNTAPQRERSGANEPGEDETSRQQLERAESGRNNNDNGISRITPNTFSIGQPRKEYGQAKRGWITEASFPNDWQNFPTQPPLCSGNDGLSSRLAGITFSKHRNESIKGYGNAIVPQVALQIFKAIEQLAKI
jgi:DNA (cytosine-5)-methyltransferase 1